MKLSVDSFLTRSEFASNLLFQWMLFAVFLMMKAKKTLTPSFGLRLKGKDLIAQIKIRGDRYGRTYVFKNGQVTSFAGVVSSPEVCVVFTSTAIAVRLMLSPKNYLKQINAMKNFQVDVEGKDESVFWFVCGCD